MTKRNSLGSLKIVLIYALIGFLWILLSDKALWSLTADHATITTISMVKGWLYVFLTAVLLYYLIERHISEIRLSDNELKSSKETFLKAFNNSPVLMTISTIDDGRYIEVNNMFTQVTGFSRQEAIGQTSIDLGWISASSRELLIIPMRRDGRVSEMEIELTAKDGRSLYCLYSGEIITIDGQERLLSIAVDITARKSASEELQKAKNHLEAITNALPDLMFRIDQEGFIHEFCSSAPELLYIQPDKFLGRKVADVMPEEPARIIMAALGEAAEKGCHRGATYSLQMPQGVKWYELSISAMGEPGIPETNFIMLARDITDRKVAEESIRQSEQKFRSIVETSQEWIWEIDLAWNHTYSNARVADILGYSLDEFLSHDFTQLIHQEDRAELDSRLPGLTARKEGWRSWVLRWRHKDGSYRFLESNADPILNESGELVGYRGTDRDITAHKLAEQSMSQYADIVNNMQVGLYVYQLENSEDDRSLRLVAANPKATSLLGLSEEDIIGSTIDEIFPGLRNAKIPEKFANVVRTGNAIEVEEFFYGDQNVQEAVFAFKAFPLPDNRVGVLFEDISLRKQAELALKNINKELEARVDERTSELKELNNELAAFNYSISHDMMAPLIRIKGFADILLDTCSAKLSDDELQYVSMLKVASTRLEEHINALLRLYEIDQGNFYLEQVNLSDLAIRILNALQYIDPARKVTFTVADGMILNADKKLMKAFLDNLLSNAWKYTSEKDDARIEVGVLEQAGRAVYFVRDNGVGFNMDQVDNLFAPFIRLHRADTGLGIGLASMQRIIRLHGGKIWAESREGEGATFYFTMQ